MYFDTAYAPFGETYASAGGTNLDPAYTGQMNDTAHRQDTAGGLYDFPAREYSIQGRWPNPDPLGVGATCPKDPQSQNRYAYVKNNPITHVDPLGLYPNDALGSCKDFIYATSHAECAVIPNPGGRDRGSDWGVGISIGLGGLGGGGGDGFGRGDGGAPPPAPFPWPQLALGFFGALDGSTRGSPTRSKWDDCRKRVFVPCMDAAERREAECRVGQGGWCAFLLASCGPLCDAVPVLCPQCISTALAKCAAGAAKCSHQFNVDVTNCFNRLIACVSKGP